MPKPNQIFTTAASLLALVGFAGIHAAAAISAIFSLQLPGPFATESMSIVAFALAGMLSSFVAATLGLPTPDPARPLPATGRSRSYLTAAARPLGLRALTADRARNALVLAYLTIYFLVGTLALIAYICCAATVTDYTKSLGLIFCGVILAAANMRLSAE